MLLAALDGFTVQPGPSGSVSLVGSVADQAALHAALHRIHDLHAEILEVRRLDVTSETAGLRALSRRRPHWDPLSMGPSSSDLADRPLPSDHRVLEATPTAARRPRWIRCRLPASG